MEDSTILNLIQNTNTRDEGFNNLLTKYQESLYWFVRRMVLVHEDANDVVQNIFLKVYNNIDRFENRSKLTTWIYSIAKNECISFIKAKKKRITHTSKFDEMMIRNLEADTYWDGDEASLLLQKSILELPPQQRLTFQMKYFEKMKYTEISQILDVSVGTAKANYHFAVKKIKKFLTKSSIYGR